MKHTKKVRGQPVVREVDCCYAGRHRLTWNWEYRSLAPGTPFAFRVNLQGGAFFNDHV